MQIILLESIDKLGQMGDVVSVKTGFARNFLLPQKKALRATRENQLLFEAQRHEIEARNLEARGIAEGVAGKIEGLTLVMLRQAGEAGQLYGSVTTRDIAAALGEKDVSATRGQVILNEPIKSIGIHDVTLRLHSEVVVGVRVNVARSTEEAELQLEKGDAVSTEDVFESKELAEAAEEALAEAGEADAAEEVSDEAPADESGESDEADVADSDEAKDE